MLAFFLQLWYIDSEVGEKEMVDMAYVISTECISCGACEGECTVSAISEGEDRYVINAELCIDCGSCASVCPVEAPNPA
jgi:Formate hydrogenlyase subunit 6/NADH:ubiquinone oxidoreductase 23 kD subunit (chain I)